MNTKKNIILHRMTHNPFFMIGIVLAVLVLFICFISPLFVRYDAEGTSLSERFLPPEGFANGLDGHVFGTDQLGRDVFTRLLTGGTASLLIAACAVFLQVFFGSVLGILAGYLGGWVDKVIMRACDVFLAIPNIILAIAVMSVMGTSVFNLIAVLTISGWVRYCKVVRNNVMVVKKQEFVSASKVLGASGLHIMFTQILPNITTPIIILASSRFGNCILVEATLSFLNLGIPAPTPSWGNMIADGRSYLSIYPWMVFAHGIALMITILAFNFLGDGLRDVLDPKKL